MHSGGRSVARAGVAALCTPGRGRPRRKAARLRMSDMLAAQEGRMPRSGMLSASCKRRRCGHFFLRRPASIQCSSCLTSPHERTTSRLGYQPVRCAPPGINASPLSPFRLTLPSTTTPSPKLTSPTTESRSQPTSEGGPALKRASKSLSSR